MSAFQRLVSRLFNELYFEFPRPQLTRSISYPVQLNYIMAGVLPPTDNTHVVAADSRVKIVSSLGIQSVKAGQTVSSGVLESVQASYATLAYHPVALVLLLIGIFIFVAEYQENENGPLEIIAGELIKIRKQATTPGFVKGFLAFLIAITNYIVRYKITVGKLALVWMTYVCKPSGRHAIISIVLSMFALVRDFSYLELILLSQIFFLYASLRNPTYKIALVVLGVAIFVTGLISVDDTADSAKELFKTLRSPAGSSGTGGIKISRLNAPGAPSPTGPPSNVIPASVKGTTG